MKKLKWITGLSLIAISLLLLAYSCNKEPLTNFSQESVSISKDYHNITNAKAEVMINAFKETYGYLVEIPIKKSEFLKFGGIQGNTINIYFGLNSIGEVYLADLIQQENFNKNISKPTQLSSSKMIGVNSFAKKYGTSKIGFCWNEPEIKTFAEISTNPY